MSPNRGLEKGKGAAIVLLLGLFLVFNLIALFIYTTSDSKEIQKTQDLTILDNEHPLGYISPVKSSETPVEIIYSGSSNSHRSSSSGSSSSSSSSKSICGNSLSEQGEECDDGNDNDYDGCTKLCEIRYTGEDDCGNNRTDSDEECDLGNNNGVQCFPIYGGTCTYCSSNCKNITKTGGFCGDGIKEADEECDDGNSINYDSCHNNCKINLIEIPVKTCQGEGELYLYYGDQFQEINKSFIVNRDELYIFTRSSYLSSPVVKINNIPTSLTTVVNKLTPFKVKVYKINTSPGDLISISGSSSYGARAVQGYLAQDSTNPAYDVNSFNLVYDDYATNNMYLLNGTYNYILFDKYSLNNDATDDSRRLNVKIADINKNYTKPYPSLTQGVVVDTYFIGESGDYEFKINTEDSVYWFLLNCTKKECCEDKDCLNDTYSEKYCHNSNVWINLTDYFCENNTCLFKITPELFTNCGNETYSEEYCYNNAVYQNHSIPGCLDSSCTLNTNSEKIEECGNNTYQEIKYCYEGDVWINISEELNFCAQGECFHPSNFTINLFEDCGESSYGDWNNYCIGKEVWRNKTDILKGCADNDCYNNEDYQNEYVENCTYDCFNGECTEPSCGNGVIEPGEECDDGNNLDGDGCSSQCTLELCEHDVGIRYIYGNSFGTGIAVGYLNGTWIEDPVILMKNEDYIIKYIIDNKIENTTNNIHVVVKLNENILADYNHSINIEHISDEINLDISNLSFGTYNLSVYVEKINEIDCNTTDNYAQREIIIKSECCDDEDCPNDTYSEEYCYNNNVWINWTDYFCSNGKCLFNIIPELFKNCGNNSITETQICYENDVYNQTLITERGCKDNSCFEQETINQTKIQECGEDKEGDWNYYCDGLEIWKNKTDIFRGCSDAQCFENEDYQNEYVDYCEQECIDGECKGECEIDSDCGIDGFIGNSYCGGNICPESVFKDFHEFICTERKKCVETITPILVDECDFTCLTIDNQARCVSSECEGVDLSGCVEWVNCVCVNSKK